MPATSTMEKMESEKGLGDQPGPRDSYKIAYIIHFLLGAGNLLPWNAFITAVDYFGNLYPTRHVEKVFSVAYMSSSVVVLILVISRGGWSKKLTYRLRMNLGFSMFVLSSMVPPTIDWFGRPKGAYGVTVASVVVCGLADGLIGGSLIGSAGKLPKGYMQAVFAGTASSGVLVSILRIITKASLPQTPKHFTLLPNDDSLTSRPTFWAVARKIRWPVFGILIIYVVTLSIFPGFIAESLASKLLEDWYPVLLITVYNVSDFVGKSLTAIYVLKSIKKATWACILRLLFYPLFAACLNGPKWLRTEVPVMSLTFLLGASNGYLTSVIMILAPKSVPVFEAELSAIVLVVFLGLGLVGGSVLGWFWIV
ncbi:hypothetical protein GH714_041389 [Hevea brasiliensis]|uniref:Uncharacterized protein n=1 Tax=Hevea brasiliensis TaxID=3981 RepID=A0A6A6MY63_HEVBR|nr:hypothetical protein GH714_041389 [Hevea brasiliensis]